MGRGPTFAQFPPRPGLKGLRPCVGAERQGMAGEFIRMRGKELNQPLVCEADEDRLELLATLDRKVEESLANRRRHACERSPHSMASM